MFQNPRNIFEKKKLVGKKNSESFGPPPQIYFYFLRFKLKRKHVWNILVTAADTRFGMLMLVNVSYAGLDQIVR